MEIFSSKDEYINELAQAKGYRLDIVIKIEELLYELAVFDTCRLLQDFTSDYEQYNYYQIENNLILVKEVTIEEIIKTVQGLYMQDFFKRLSPSNDIDLTLLKRVF